MRAPRNSLQPGQVFRWWRYPERLDCSVALVVLDAKREVDFWNGGEWCVGDVAPSVDVEVLS